jgi:twinkle protein
MDTITQRPPLIVTTAGILEDVCRAAGYKHVLRVMNPSGYLDAEGKVRAEISFFEEYVIVIPRGGEEIRNQIAVALGEENCSWAYCPEDDLGPEAMKAAISARSRMWSDEIASLDDIPDPGPRTLYQWGMGPTFDRPVVEGGQRIELPAFMAIVGPKSAGKSTLLRQCLVRLWRTHKWKFLLTSFEEKVKHRYQHQLRRHLIEKPMEVWTDSDKAHADAEINRACKFLLRKRGSVLDIDQLIRLIEYAVKVYGLKVIAIDPWNEIWHRPEKGENLTDYVGRSIMRLKQLADDYGLLLIVCVHPNKDSAEKRLSKTGLLTLYDAADSAHWANKPDIGWCAWRNIDGPTMLHIDKIKDHEFMGDETLMELRLDKALGRFDVTRVGYDILREGRGAP